jgi:hypothetical protein
MKSYTDIEQSKKLAEILPAESADMCFNISQRTNMPPLMTPYCKFKEFFNMGETPDFLIPCWSLTALLKVLDFAKCDIHKDIYGWKCYTWPNNWKYDSNWNDNPIDACYEMILKLHELKML